MRILTNEFVIPLREGWESHASHFALLPDGRVYCVYFYGSKEGADDVRIFGSMRSVDGVWGAPVAITEDDGVPHWNPVLFEREDGTHVLFYKVGKSIPDWQTYYRTSNDGCMTWSKAYELVPGDVSGGRGPVRNKVITLRDGSILAPGSTEQGEWKCCFDRSTDGGVTWMRSADVAITPYMDGKYETLEKHGIIQPTLWESAEGVHALMRSTEDRIYRTDSKDGSEWCLPYPLEMPNNNSGIDVSTAPDGRVFLVCNPVERAGGRTPLSVYVSSDNGMTFTLFSHLVTGAGKFAYPAVRYADGCLHVTYTWNRKTIGYICLADI